MDTKPQDNDEQTKLWNGHAGHAWVDAQALLDGMFQPFARILGEVVPSGSGWRVLDVGCGTGATTFSLADRVGPNGHCTGVDLSAPMIAAADARAERAAVPVTFICTDAQTHRFPSASFDAVVSRFGVMFFADPVGAFANFRAAAAAGAVLRFVAWRTAEENPFMTTAERAAAPYLPDLPARRLEGPGQFAFADQRKTQRILEQGGWADVKIAPVDVTCTFPVAELSGYVERMGPVGVALRSMDSGNRRRVAEQILPAFDRYVHGNDVQFTAACCLVDAKADGSAH